MNTTPVLSQSILDRIEAVVLADPAVQQAEKEFYTLWGKLEHTNPALYEALDGAFVEVLLAHRSAVWADGWRSGRNPDRLVFEAPAELPDTGTASDVDAWLQGGAS